MSKSISFSVLGEPVAKQRPKISTFGGFARAYTPTKTQNYENKVLMSFQNELKCDNYEDTYFGDSLVEMEINVYFAIPKSCYCKKGLNKSGREKMDKIYCDTHKDLDNIVKSILDGLNKVAFKDDKQVVKINACKKWTTQMSRVEITIKEV